MIEHHYFDAHETLPEEQHWQEQVRSEDPDAWPVDSAQEEFNAITDTGYTFDDVIPETEDDQYLRCGSGDADRDWRYESSPSYDY